MVRDELNVLASFLVVAEERSFTKAAGRLGVSTSALSHSVRGLEERIGVRLLARTTRSVRPTDAGEQLIARFGPALGDIHEALDTVTGLDRGDLVAGRFDAGIHLGEFIERDMIVVKVSADQRPAIVASPAYFAAHKKPRSPHELTEHRCINFRHGSSGIYRWELDKGRQSLAVAVNGPVVVDDVDVLIRATIDGVGLAFSLESQVAHHVANGALVRVLEDWCPPFPGYFLYYPSRRQQPPALSALIEFLRI